MRDSNGEDMWSGRDFEWKRAVEFIVLWCELRRNLLVGTNDLTHYA